jgi:hypothetical protein
MTRRGSVPDLAFALFLIVFGVAVLALTGDLRTGTTARMGPGFVPRGLAWITIVYGVGLAIPAFLAPFQMIAGVKLRSLLFIAASLALFAILFPRVGLAAAGFVAMICGSAAASDSRPLEALIFALVLTAFAIGLFVYALRLPFAVWPWT